MIASKRQKKASNKGTHIFEYEICISTVQLKIDRSVEKKEAFQDRKNLRINKKLTLLQLIGKFQSCENSGFFKELSFESSHIRKQQKRFAMIWRFFFRIMQTKTMARRHKSL